jgi:hypothetical protein
MKSLLLKPFTRSEPTLKGSSLRLILLVICGVLGLLSTNQLYAQTLTTLHRFANTNDGANPQSAVIISSNVLYGTTYTSVPYNMGTGTVFKMNTDGSGFTTLHFFTNGDGAGPAGRISFIQQHALRDCEWRSVWRRHGVCSLN